MATVHVRDGSGGRELVQFCAMFNHKLSWYSEIVLDSYSGKDMVRFSVGKSMNKTGHTKNKFMMI